MIEMGIEHVLSPTTIQVNIADNACLIKQVEQFRQRAIVPGFTKIRAEVIVGIKDRKTRLFNQGRPCY